jgi:hypothetical protein
MWFKIAHEYPRLGFRWPSTTVYERRANSLSISCICEPEIHLAILRRHIEVAERYGRDGFERFRPMGEKIAEWACFGSIRQGDVQTLRMLLAGHRQLVRHWFLSRLAIVWPQAAKFCLRCRIAINARLRILLDLLRR